MGNQVPRSSPPPLRATPIPPYYPPQGQYYPQPNMVYQAPNPKRRPVMDCNEAAQRYGGFVVSEYGSNLKKPQDSDYGN